MSRTRQRETEEQVSASVPELPQSSTGLDHDQLPSPSRMAGLSASVGGLNLLQ